MKTKRMMVMGLAALCAIALAGEASAANGKGSANAKGSKKGTATATKAQKRDGSFMTSGTTANGATVRPSNGKGLQDGSHLATAPAAQ